MTGTFETALDSKTLLQVNATAIVGVLFFLTLSSFLTTLTEDWARIMIGIVTLTIIIPFVLSSILILGNINVSNWAKSATGFGFAYLAIYLAGTILYPFFPNTDPGNYFSTISIQDDCENNPKLYNVTDSECAKFGEGSRAEECATNPQRFGMKISECSMFSGPNRTLIMPWPWSEMF
jgi:hypothetical protein